LSKNTTRNSAKFIQSDKVKVSLGINTVIDKMLSHQKKVIHDHIKRFLDTGGMLEELSVEKNDDVLTLRSAGRTVVTVKIQVVGRNLNTVAFKVIEDISK